MAYIEGKLQNRDYEKDGVKRTSTEVIAREVVFLSSPKDRPQGGASMDDGFGAPPAPFPSDEDMPF